jgi:NAD(P)-dependent dehydrogenase (short-subunit alcohol dehydrogenase family)
MAVAFTDSDRERGGALAAETGALFLEWDPLDRAACDRAVSEALRATGDRLDVLVTNAPRSFDGSLENTPESVLQDLLEANLTSAFRVARACFAPMHAQGGGSMIHVASAAGIRAAHETAAYSVAAAGVIALAELFAAEGAPYSVRSNAVCPAAGDTGADVAPLVAWLASDESTHVSGATLRVDRGAGAAMVIDTRA